MNQGKILGKKVGKEILRLIQSDMPQGWGINLDHFQRVRHIGTGSFGDVWLVQDTERNIPLALKFLHNEMIEQGHLDLFKKEFEILTHLRHAHLGRVYDFGFSTQDQQYFFTSEYCPGVPFLQAVSGKGTDYLEKGIVQLLSALDYVHAQGVVHFDLKSDNILVADHDGSPSLKLLDFGIASQLGDLKSRGLRGTPSHMAPELLRGSPHVDHRADLYSLGMICLIGLTGKYPFDLKDTEAIVQWHLEGQVPESQWTGRDCPKHLREITLKLLAKNPQERFSHARAVLNFINLTTGRRHVGVEHGVSEDIPSHGPLVEREGPLKTLKASFHSKIHENSPTAPNVFLLSGEEGIGKSRLIEELRHVAELAEVPVMQILCDYERSTWQRIREGLARQFAAAPVGGGQQDSSSGEREGQWLVIEEADLLLNQARQKPFCLLLDDFHKVDRFTRSILNALCEMPSAPLFILAASKESEKDALRLEKVSPDGVRQYAELVLGGADGVSVLAGILARYSGGLPLLMVEGMRYLAPYFHRGEPLDRIEPPKDILELYRDRLKTLAPDDRDVLDLCALVFRPLVLDEIATISKRLPQEVFKNLQAAIRLQLISPSHGDTFVLSNQAFALSLIESLKPERRATLHRQIADGLLSSPNYSFSEVAFHLGKCGRADEALALYESAIEDCKKRSLYGTAIDCFRKAIPFCEKGGPAWRHLMEEGATLLILSGAYKEAETVLKDLSALPSRTLYELQGWLELKGRHYDLARTAYENALASLGPNEIAAKISITNYLANIAYHQGDLDRSERLYRMTLGLEKGVADEQLKGLATNHLGMVLADRGDIEAARQFYRERLGMLSVERHADIVAILSSLGYILLRARIFDASILCLQQAIEIAEFSKALHFIFPILGNLSTVLLKIGRYGECLPLLKKMLSHQARIGSKRDRAFNYLRVGGIYLTLGMEEMALDCFNRGSLLAEMIGETHLFGWFDLMRGYYEKDCGRLSEARVYYEKVLKDFEGTATTDVVAWAAIGLAELLEREGRDDDCRKKMTEIGPLSQDPEFQTRWDLLNLRLKTKAGDPGLDSSFQDLEKKCLENDTKEVLCELYHLWSLFLEKGGDSARAIRILGNSIDLLKEMASGLPEELRHRYLQHGYRKAVAEDWLRMSGVNALSERKTPSPEVITLQGAGNETLVQSTEKH